MPETYEIAVPADGGDVVMTTSTCLPFGYEVRVRDGEWMFREHASGAWRGGASTHLGAMVQAWAAWAQSPWVSWMRSVLGKSAGNVQDLETLRRMVAERIGVVVGGGAVAVGATVAWTDLPVNAVGRSDNNYVVRRSGDRGWWLLHTKQTWGRCTPENTCGWKWTGSTGADASQTALVVVALDVPADAFKNSDRVAAWIAALPTTASVAAESQPTTTPVVKVGDVVARENLPDGALARYTDGDILLRCGSKFHWVHTWWTVASSTPYPMSHGQWRGACTVLALGVSADATVEDLRKLVRDTEATGGRLVDRRQLPVNSLARYKDGDILLVRKDYAAWVKIRNEWRSFIEDGKISHEETRWLRDYVVVATDVPEDATIDHMRRMLEAPTSTPGSAPASAGAGAGAVTAATGVKPGDVVSRADLPSGAVAFCRRTTAGASGGYIVRLGHQGVWLASAHGTWTPYQFHDKHDWAERISRYCAEDQRVRVVLTDVPLDWTFDQIKQAIIDSVKVGVTTDVASLPPGVAARVGDTVFVRASVNGGYVVTRSGSTYVSEEHWGDSPRRVDATVVAVGLSSFDAVALRHLYAQTCEGGAV